MAETANMQDISDAEQLPVPLWKRNDDQQSSINTSSLLAQMWFDSISHSFLH